MKSEGLFIYVFDILYNNNNSEKSKKSEGRDSTPQAASLLKRTVTSVYMPAFKMSNLTGTFSAIIFILKILRNNIGERKAELIMNGQNRDDIKIGALVDIVLKADQQTDKLTRGHVKRILTNSSFHPHGIKVMLIENNVVGRVKKII